MATETSSIQSGNSVITVANQITAFLVRQRSCYATRNDHHLNSSNSERGRDGGREGGGVREGGREGGGREGGKEGGRET